MLLTGLKTINETIESVIRQECAEWEILILRNDIQDLPQGTDVAEKDVFYQDNLTREIYIRKKGKGNALNVGICYARNALVCVIDADCILQEDALSKAVKHFQNDEVVAVGGRLLVKREDSSQLEAIQFCEYMKTFQLSRRIFARLNAQCLISGAFGVFRKSTLLGINGYDIGTVGEDMELVLRLQEQDFQKSKKRIVYEATAVCYTGVPHSIKRLLHQRDRWQRGLMDCLIKHHNLIANPHYGLLGLVTMCYQFMVELLGPIYWVIYTVLLIEKKMLSFLMLVRVERITGKTVKLYEGDVKDHSIIRMIFKENKIDCVIHFAGLKAVGESVAKPILYYRNNIDTTLTLLECMEEAGVENIIFSSSATVYGEENPVPYIEEMKKGSCTNPYGWTKSMMEQILTDATVANQNLSLILLRYFNPIGTHESGMIGEDPQGIPNNLMPYVAQVAVGRREQLTIFGNDYPTPDGTCRRDYIHVVDLAKGHVKAVEYALAHKGVEIINLGTGTPYSVTEIVESFEKSTGVEIKHVYGDRRPGDLPESYANADKAWKLLGWKAEKSLEDMCRDTWNWRSKNPKGV